MGGRAHGDGARQTGVLIVEEHPSVRAVVRAACEASERLSVVGEAADGEGALDECRRLHPDVVVLDPQLSGSDGYEIARLLREQQPPPRILVLTDRIDGEAVLAWMRARVEGFLPKSSGVRTIAGAIETVAEGGRVFAPEHEREAVVELGRLARAARDDAGAPVSLSRREDEVLRLLSDGLTIQQVASRIRISPRTVESHVTRLYRKLGVRTRVQALARAAELGFLDLGPQKRE
jgi:DNA-binding NarL/FixJ family response regulator